MHGDLPVLGLTHMENWLSRYVLGCNHCSLTLKIHSRFDENPSYMNGNIKHWKPAYVLVRESPSPGVANKSQ